ncbi:hypothetical protein [Nonomuraea rubra]|uniref:hypothetical protein n=1 Tax=Nonomuraea rubra TaxID=46180 RepID=UPI0033C2C3FC
MTELYWERYGDPDELDLERLHRAAARPATPVTTVEALGHVRELVLAAGGSTPCLVCWVLHRRQHHPNLDRSHAYTPISRGA